MCMQTWSESESHVACGSALHHAHRMYRQQRVKIRSNVAGAQVDSKINRFSSIEQLRNVSKNHEVNCPNLQELSNVFVTIILHRRCMRKTSILRH